MSGLIAHFFFEIMSIDLNKIEQLLTPLAGSLGLELVACEWVTDRGRRILRVLIDKPEGVKLEDCESFSRLMDPALEVEALISESYDLEVSSPGLQRPLKKKTDFERFKGQQIFVRSKEALENRSNFKGLLREVKENSLLLEIDRQQFEIPFEKIAKAHLEPDLGNVLKNKKK